MAISVISVSSDSSEASIPIVLHTVPPIVSPSPDHTLASPDYSPASPDYTPASPDYSRVSDTESDLYEDPSSDHIPTLPAILPFLSSTDDTTDSDTPDMSPSPTHGTPFTKINPSTQRSPIIPRHRVMILASGQPIPYRRPYWYHLNGPLHMLTARKRVGPLPTHRLADASSDSSSRHSLPDHSSPDLWSTSAGPSRKRLDVEVDSRESSEPSRSRGTDVRIDDDIKRVDESHLEHEINPVQMTIEACFDFVNIIRSRGIDVRVVTKTVARDETRTDMRDIVEGGDDRVTPPVVSEDVQEAAQEERAAEGTEQGHRIVGVESAVIALTERIVELERDNRRLRGTASVKGPRVDRLQLEEMEAREVAMNLEPLNESGDEQEGENGGNGSEWNGENRNRNGGNRNGGNGENGNGNRGNGNGGRNRNGNRNGNHGMNYRDFMLCFDLVELHKRPIGVDVAYAMKLARLMKLMTEVYCPRNEIQKIKTELWNLTVKGNDLTAYTQRFQELVLLCNRMVFDEEDRVERFIGGLPDNIQENVIGANPARLQDAIRIANQLMDKKLQGYATRSAKNKRRTESNPRDNHVQQSPFKRHNVGRQNVARAYTARNNERRGYTRPHPLYNKCIYHHVGPCTVKCNNCKRVGHRMRDYKSTVVVPNLQRALLGNQQGVICYECGRPRHVKRDCLMLRNQNHRNKVRNKTGNKTSNNEAIARAYAIGGGGANPDSNVITGTFLLNNCYASMLFDSGADRSFMSSTFSAFLDVASSTLDTRLLGHPFDIDLMPVELGSFDVIIGMDLMAKNHAVIVCDEMVVCISYGDEVLIIQSDDIDDRSKSKLNIISFTATTTYLIPPKRGMRGVNVDRSYPYLQDKSRNRETAYRGPLANVRVH
nr:hypothetical protein [Tanacetum cinerariifolium]